MFCRRTAAFRSRSLFKAVSCNSGGIRRENCRFQIFSVSLSAKPAITSLNIFHIVTYRKIKTPASVSEADQGDYRLVVGNSLGSANSLPARLKVITGTSLADALDITDQVWSLSSPPGLFPSCISGISITRRSPAPLTAPAPSPAPQPTTAAVNTLWSPTRPPSPSLTRKRPSPRGASTAPAPRRESRCRCQTSVSQ